MTPQATFDAFWSALDRRAWQEAADLVHPDHARRRQRQDLNLIQACLSAMDHRRETGQSSDGVLIMGSSELELTPEFRGRPVSTFPGTPLLGDLADLSPNVFLAHSFAAQAQRGERLAGRKPGFPKLELIRTVEESADVAHVEFRIPELKVEDEDNPVHRVTLRLADGAWRLQLDPDAFAAPLPWLDEGSDNPGSSRAAV